MLRKSKHKTVLVANLNGEQVVFLVRKKYKTALKCYIDDMVNEYLDIIPPQSLKDFIIDSIIKMQGEWIEILAGVDVYDAVAEV